jgi:GT2 family glycosyltransferase
MPDSKRTLIVIIQYGDPGEALKCIATLRDAGWPEKDILIVDNGPNGDLEPAVAGKFPEVHVNYTGENRGFAGGCNAGIRDEIAADYEFLFIINNDVEMRDDVIAKLEAVMDADPTIGVAGPINYADDEAVVNQDAQFAGALIDWTRGQHVDHHSEDFPFLGDKPYDVDFVCGCTMLFRREMLDKMDLFDERYFLYWEDAEFCYRIRDAGFRTVMVPNTQMLHAMGTTTGFGSPLVMYYLVRNRFLFIEDRASSPEVAKKLIRRATMSRLTKGVRNIFKGKTALGMAHIHGVLDYHRRKLGQTGRFTH